MDTGTITPENIHDIQKNLSDTDRVESVTRGVSIAFEALGVPREKPLYEGIRKFVYEEGNRVLRSVHSEEIVPKKSENPSSNSSKDFFSQETIEKMEGNIKNAELVKGVFRSIASCLSSIGVPASDELYLSIHKLIKQEIEKVYDSSVVHARNWNSSRETIAEDMESEDFHIDSTEWQEIVLPDKTRVKVNPELDVTEVLEGEFKGKQFFSQVAAIRETKKMGKRIPNNDEWKSILRSIDPVMIFNGDPQVNTSVRETLALDLRGYQYGSHGNFKEKNIRWYYWSSSFNTDFGYYVTIEKELVDPIRSTSRIHMFSVRCLKQEE